MAIPGGGQSADVTITATSAADPTKSGTATATITPVPTPTVSITPCCGPNTPTSGSIAFSATLQNAPADTQINWFLGCASNDEGDVDECTDDDNDNTPPLPPAKIDGPGLMVTANAIQSDTVITNASSITYYAPSSVYQPLTASVLTLQMATKIQSVSLPTIAAYPCSLGTSNTEYVPIAAYINVNGTYYLSQWACIQVTGP